MGVVRGLRHPYAALLLADYILSKEGQQILAKAEVFPGRSGRRAAAVNSRRSCRKIAGVPENFIGPDKLIKYTDSSEEIFQKLFR